MNILVVSQNFTRGGLETQIYTQYTAMKNENNFSFAFSNYSSNFDFGNAKIYTGFKFSADSSIEEFYQDVNKLVEIVKENKIDIIHAHPFYSIFPAVFAAKIMNIPIVYTYHGVISFNFTNQINDNLLFKAIIESEIDKVFSVSETGVYAMQHVVNNSDKVVFLPNAIDLTKYKKNVVIDNKNWALISRIDSDKIEEIKKIISVMDEIDINKICIYGDGNKKEELQQYIAENELHNKVLLMGHCDNISEELNNKYNGIIGTSRAAMEAIAMGYPTLLTGYGKIAGIIDLQLYNSIKKENFINKILPDITVDKLKQQIQNVYLKEDARDELYKLFISEYSSNEIYMNYKKEIDNITIMSSYDMPKIYEEIGNLKRAIPNENIYSSRSFYNVLKRYIELEAVSISLKDDFNKLDLYFNLLDEISKIRSDIENKYETLVETIVETNKKSLDDFNNLLYKEVSDINEKINIIKEEQSNIQDKINIKFLTYNSWNRAKNRFKK